MELVFGVIVLVAVGWAVLRRPTQPPVVRREPAARSSSREKLRREEFRRQDAGDAAFVEGVLFAHYFGDDRRHDRDISGPDADREVDGSEFEQDDDDAFFDEAFFDDGHW